MGCVIPVKFLYYFISYQFAFACFSIVINKIKLVILSQSPLLILTDFLKFNDLFVYSILVSCC